MNSLHFTMIASVFAGVIQCDVIATNTSSAYYRLRQDLLNREAARGRVPPGGGVTSITVGVHFIPLTVLDIDDVRQVVTLTTTLTLQWVDPELSWNNSLSGPYPGIEDVQLPPQELWQPMVYLPGGAMENLLLDFSNSAMSQVHSSGSIILTTSLLVPFSCPMDLTYYPFDTQECRFQVWLLSPVQIYAHAATDPLALRKLFGNFVIGGEWLIVDITTENAVAFNRNQYPVYNLKLKRKTAFYVVSFIGPVVMTSYMNTLVFVMPKESGERVSYLVSIFVSNAVFIGFCTNQMPQGMDSPPLVMYLLLGIMAESGLLVIVVSFLERHVLRHSRVTPSPNDVGKDQQEENPLHAPDVRRLWKLPTVHPDAICFLIALVLNTGFVVSLLVAMI